MIQGIEIEKGPDPVDKSWQDINRQRIILTYLDPEKKSNGSRSWKGIFRGGGNSEQRKLKEKT